MPCFACQSPKCKQHNCRASAVFNPSTRTSPSKLWSPDAASPFKLWSLNTFALALIQYTVTQQRALGLGAGVASAIWSCDRHHRKRRPVQR